MATTTTTKTAAAPAEAGDQAAETQNAATANELARIQANQDRYDARVGGKSSAQVNADEAAKAAEGKDEPEVAPGGGQTLPAHTASGEPASGAVVAEPPAETPSTTGSRSSTSSSSSGSTSGS